MTTQQPSRIEYSDARQDVIIVETIRQSTRGLADVTVTLSGAEAELILAALHVFGNLASGKGADKDTDATGEALDTYWALSDRFSGVTEGLGRVSSAVVDALAATLKSDMLAIVHRNYRQTKTGLVER